MNYLEPNINRVLILSSYCGGITVRINENFGLSFLYSQSWQQTDCIRVNAKPTLSGRGSGKSMKNWSNCDFQSVQDASF